ncbi:MAG: hypothetical protein ACK4Q5_12160 [Saprospiraceae bacterium]
MPVLLVCQPDAYSLPMAKVCFEKNLFDMSYPQAFLKQFAVSGRKNRATVDDFPQNVGLCSQMLSFGFSGRAKCQ